MRKGEQVMGEFWNLYNKRIMLDNYRMKEQLKGFKPSEIHCIEYIGKNKDANVTRLAEAFYITRSATSKITRKLLEKGLIESYQKPDNKKEIYFKLTRQGQAVCQIHDDLHREFEERDQSVFEQVPKLICRPDEPSPITRRRPFYRHSVFPQDFLLQICAFLCYNTFISRV